MKEIPKSISLPESIAAYFATDQNGEEAVCQCFTDDAVVTDEGHTYRGRAAIKKWKRDASVKYQYTSEPFAHEEKDGRNIVTSRVAGNFPGSPIDIQYAFKLQQDKIVTLEISA